MQTITISTTYTLKWQIKGLDHYKVSVCGKVFNSQRNREIKKVLNGSSVGFWIAKDFLTLKELSTKLEKIPETICPF